jgi:hypothetical protein
LTSDDPLLADRRNFFKVELWTKDGLAPPLPPGQSS